MIIRRDITNNGNLNTELLNVLTHIPSNIIFSNEHKIRPPLGIYSVSTQRVFTAFNNITDSILNKSNEIVISNNHKELVDSLMAYIDDGYHLMKVLFPKNAVKKEIQFANHWLSAVNEDIKKVIVNHQKQIKPYRIKLALINNKIKHQHARYGHIEMSTIYGKILGYYIEGVNEDGAIIPETEIHPKFDNDYTAISYNKDLRQLLVYFYIISSLIAKTIRKIIDIQHNIRIPEVKVSVDSSKNNEILMICQKISNLPHLYFPDEYYYSIPQIIVSKNGESIEFREEAYKSYLKKLSKYYDSKVKMSTSGDEVSRSWALPYLAKKDH